MADTQIDTVKIIKDVEAPLEKESVQASPAKQTINPNLWRFMMVIGVGIYGSYPIFIQLCNVGGKFDFSPASMVFTTEFAKFCISLFMFIPEAREKGFQVPSLWVALPFAVPALLYSINNNLTVLMQLQMDPATFQVLGNMKILSTAVLYRLIIKRPITGMQWFALGLLAVAGAFNSYGGLKAKGGSGSGEVHITLVGLIMITIYCLLSGLAGVYSEYILKKRFEMSLHLQNSMLYSFGMIMNFSGWLYMALTSENPNALHLFHGYSVYTWMMVLFLSTQGLIMSVIFKHGSNITRLFFLSCAMLVTMTLSIVIFHLKINTYFGVAFVLVILALGLYHHKK